MYFCLRTSVLRVLSHGHSRSNAFLHLRLLVCVNRLDANGGIACSRDEAKLLKRDDAVLEKYVVRWMDDFRNHRNQYVVALELLHHTLVWLHTADSPSSAGNAAAAAKFNLRDLYCDVSGTVAAALSSLIASRFPR